VQRQVGRVDVGWSASFTDEVKVAKGNGERLRWVAKEEFGGETADGDISAADGVKEGCVERGAERARDISGEGNIFEDRDGGKVGLMEKVKISGVGLGVWGRLERGDESSGGCGGGVGGGM
jgi:hypothetical protein